MAVYHVRPRPPGNPEQWAVEKRGASRASSVHGSKVAALGNVESIAEDGDKKVIHNADGSVAKRRTINQSKRKSSMRDVRRKTGKSPFDL